MFIMRLLVLSVCVLMATSLPVFSSEDVFTNDFAVEVDGDDDVADLVAGTHGFQLVSRVFSHKGGTYHFVHPELSHRAKRSAEDLVAKLQSDPNVKYVEQQKLLVREKREIIYDKQLDFPVNVYEDKSIYQRYEHDSKISTKDKIPGEDMEGMSYKDPYFKDQWYLLNRGQSGGVVGKDVHIMDAWRKGFTGKGSVVCILDDGLDHLHEDLKRNYDPKASIDLNGKDSNPEPNTNDASNSHGTRCAGEIAAQANNDYCGVGIAYDSKIGGVRMLDGSVTDVLEARALTFAKDHVTVYSASWGPRDDGQTMEAPSKYARDALREGAETGRNGKGAIYMWATGNGGAMDDCCNADGYVSSIYTLSVGSVNDEGLSTYFMEKCASTMAVIHTGGAHTSPGSKEKPRNPKLKVVTTDINNGCVLGFQGTSAAAPLAAGCMALVLQANPDLTWRDVQHIVAATAKIPNSNETGWWVNGAGYHINNKFGFGVMDCSKMVEAAQKWVTVPPQHNCTVPDAGVNKPIQSGKCVRLTLTSDGCSGDADRGITKLEHVQALVRLNTTRRGDISLKLISPAGTRSEILSTRKSDSHPNIDFTFMTVHNWGENPSGKWTLEVCDTPIDPSQPNTGVVLYWSLVLWGTGSNGEKIRSRKAYKPADEEVHRLIATEAEKSTNVDIRGVNEKAVLKKTDSRSFTNTVDEVDSEVHEKNVDDEAKKGENKVEGSKTLLKDIKKQVEKLLAEREVSEPQKVYKKNIIESQGQEQENIQGENTEKAPVKSLEKEEHYGKDVDGLLRDMNGENEELSKLLQKVEKVVREYEEEEEKEKAALEKQRKRAKYASSKNSEKKSDIDERVMEFLQNLEHI